MNTDSSQNKIFCNIDKIYCCTSSVDTVTVTHTTDLVVHYHGRAINTQLLEEEVRSPLYSQ